MLSKNFSLLELTKSQTAERRGISNNPNADHIFNLTALAENILQPIRNEFGSFAVSSGYRCVELCEVVLRWVGLFCVELRCVVLW